MQIIDDRRRLAAMLADGRENLGAMLADERLVRGHDNFAEAQGFEIDGIGRLAQRMVPARL